MNRKHNVTVGLDEIGNKILEELTQELAKQSIKSPNISETIRVSI